MKCKSQLGAKCCAQKDAAHKTRVLPNRYWVAERELSSKLHSWCQFFPGFISQSCPIIQIYSKLILQNHKKVDHFCTLGQKNLVTQADIWALNNPGRKFTLNNLGRKFTEAIYSLLFLFDWATITLFQFSWMMLFFGSVIF